MDPNMQTPVFEAAKVSPATSTADVEVRWRRISGTGTPTVSGRTLVIVKSSSITIQEASAVGNHTDSSLSYEVLDSLTIPTPVSDTYVAIASLSFQEGTIGSNNQVDGAIHVGGTPEADTERTLLVESSFDGTDFVIYVTGIVNPNGSQDVDFRWHGSATHDRIAHSRTMVLLSQAPAFAQSAYRFFNNDADNDTDVGAVLADRNTAATLISDGQDFRLRLLIHISNGHLAASGQNLKLQIATKVGGNCDTNMSTTDESYSDLSASSGDIRYYDDTDSNKTDGANLIANVNDPTHSDPAHNTVEQDYEEANNFTNTIAAIPSGEDGEWDFSIVDFSAADNTTYCLRIVESGGTVLNTYTVVPEFTTVPENSLLLFGLYPLLSGLLKRIRNKKR